MTPRKDDEIYWNIKQKICNNPNHDPNLCKPMVHDLSSYKNGLGYNLFHAMKKNDDKIAQIDSETGRKEPYNELLSRCIRIAQNLREKGVTSNDIISFNTQNNMDCFATAMAVFFVGAKIASLDPSLSIKETNHLIKLTEPKIIFCDEDGLKNIEESLKQTGHKAEIVYYGSKTEYTPFSEFLILREDEELFEPHKVDDVQETAIIFFTSGTTGLPKGIATSHFALMYQSTLIDYSFVTYAITRMYWMSATVIYTFSTFSGGSWVVCADFDMKKIFKLIDDFKISFILAPPLYGYQLTENAEYCKYDTSSLKIICMVGGKTGGDQLEKLRNLFPDTLVGVPYGMSETVGTICSFPLDNIDLLLAKPTSIGIPAKGTCFKVVDAETEQPVGPNIPGELRIKCSFMMNGYFRNPKGTAEAFDSEGYYCTGDVVYYDEEYCFYVVDRIKDMMKYRGFQFSSAELEAILLSHPSVLEAVVVSIPHEQDGDLPCGIVVFKENTNTTAEELIKFFDAQVTEPKKLRGGLKIVDNIPKTPSFKLRKRDLRNLILEGQI